MKAGTIFEHPTKDGGVVRLKAIKEISGCTDCIFWNPKFKDCKTGFIERNRGITGECVGAYDPHDLIFISAGNEESGEESIAEADISYSVDVSCPHCGNYFDSLGQLHEMELDPFKEANTERGHVIICPRCGKEFRCKINY